MAPAAWPPPSVGMRAAPAPLGRSIAAGAPIARGGAARAPRTPLVGAAGRSTLCARRGAAAGGSARSTALPAPAAAIPAFQAPFKTGGRAVESAGSAAGAAAAAIAYSGRSRPCGARAAGAASSSAPTARRVRVIRRGELALPSVLMPGVASLPARHAQHAQQRPPAHESQRAQPRRRQVAMSAAAGGAAAGGGDASSDRPQGGKSEPPAALQSFDPDDYPAGFMSRRLLCFLGIVVGYTGLYFTRGSLTYTAPVMLSDPLLNISITDIGAMTSAFPLAYGLSKFLGGVLGAKFSARLMLGGGLLITALINLGFGLCEGVGVFTALWFLNGSLQGIGAPASSVLLTRWFASQERGTWWGLWNIGANIGGFLTPLLVGTVASTLGWQWGMWVPGMIGLLFAVGCLAAVRDSPEEAGYTVLDSAESRIGGVGGGAAKPKQQEGGGVSIRAALKETVSNKGVWLLAFAYFFVYVVRQGATSWLVMYLLQAKGASDAAHAAYTVSGLELGGLLGGSLSGVLTDMRIKAAIAAEREAPGSGGGYVGKRVQIVMMYSLATLAVLFALRAVPAGSIPLQWAVIAMLGFTIYGPQMLIGLCGAELVSKTSVSTSQGVLGLVSYMGAASAGVPLSYVLKNFGWDGYFMAMAAASLSAIALLLPLANARSQAQGDST